MSTYFLDLTSWTRVIRCRFCTLKVLPLSSSYLSTNGKLEPPEENNNQKNSTAKWNKKEVNIEKQKNNKICLVHSESINILANDAGAHCSGVSGVDARRSGSDRKGDIWGNFVGDWATIWMTEQIRCYKTFFFYLFLIIYLKNLRQRVDGLSRVVLAKSFL